MHVHQPLTVEKHKHHLLCATHMHLSLHGAWQALLIRCVDRLLVEGVW
jgi:hypothetical protein